MFPKAFLMHCQKLYGLFNQLLEFSPMTTYSEGCKYEQYALKQFFTSSLSDVVSVSLSLPFYHHCLEHLFIFILLG